MDNGIVFCVSMIHRVGYTINRLRKKPQITKNNHAHINKVCGDKGAVPIHITKLIDDYNYWMGGVDVSDQRIAY